jgi:hypothetical protein
VRVVERCCTLVHGSTMMRLTRRCRLILQLMLLVAGVLQAACKITSGVVVVVTWLSDTKGHVSWKGEASSVLITQVPCSLQLRARAARCAEMVVLHMHERDDDETG